MVPDQAKRNGWTLDLKCSRLSGSPDSEPEEYVCKTAIPVAGMSITYVSCSTGVLYHCAVLVKPVVWWYFEPSLKLQILNGNLPGIGETLMFLMVTGNSHEP